MAAPTWLRIAPWMVAPTCLAIALLPAAGACRAPALDSDPLASIADPVDEDEITPPPLAEAWRRAPEQPVSLRPAVGFDSVYLAIDNRLLGWDAADGRSRWAPVELESTIGAPPVAVGDRIGVATRGNDASPPRLLWFSSDSTPLSLAAVEAPITELAAAGDAVVFLDARGVGRIDGGAAGWHTALEGPATVELAVEPGLALVTTRDGRLVALDLASGNQRWEFDAGGQISRARAVGERVYVGGAAVGVVALRARDGSVDWQRRLGTSVVGAPAVARDLVWVAAFDAKLRAFKAGNGTEMETFLVDLSARNYLDLISFGPWVIAGASYGPWIAVRGPMSFERRQRPTEIRVRQPNVPDHPDLTVPAGAGPAGVAVVNWDGTVAFLRPVPR